MRRVISTFTAVTLCVSASSVWAEDVITRIALPKSAEQAEGTEPSCGDPNAVTDADKIVKGLGIAADTLLIGTDLLTQVLNDPKAADWVKSRLGLNRGKATCGVMCVTIPANKPVLKADACVWDGFGRQCGLSNGHSDIFVDYWGGTRARGEAFIKGKPETTKMVKGKKVVVTPLIEDRKLVCTLAKNWSHDRDRIVSWRVWY